MTQERPISREIISVINPAFYLCAGVSGAGCATAVRQSFENVLAQLGPPKFVTRILRPTERRGDQYYPVTDIILGKIPNQIAIQDTIYGNKYGFFKPAIEKVRRAIDSSHIVILNAKNTPDEWRQVLGNNYRVVSLFFAPSNPEETVKRIIARAEQGNQKITPETLEVRKRTNSQNIHRLLTFDYWIDTTVFDEVMPAVTTVMETESDGVVKSHNRLLSVRGHPKEINALIKAYTGVNT